MGRPKGSIVPPDVRRSRTNLAILLREALHEEIIWQWFLMIMSGKNPIIVQDKRYSEHGGLKVVEDPNNRIAPSPERRDQAMRSLLDRRDGLPPQRMQLEAEIRQSHEHTVIAASELVQLRPQQLGALAKTLRGLLSPPQVVPNPDPVEVGPLSATPEPGE